MGTTPKSLPRRRSPREQVVLGACPNCGTARVVMPCANVRCDAWFMVCDCNDASETSYSAGGNCEECRSLPSETASVGESPLRRTPRTSRGMFRTPYARRVVQERVALAKRRAAKGGA